MTETLHATCDSKLNTESKLEEHSSNKSDTNDDDNHNNEQTGKLNSNVEPEHRRVLPKQHRKMKSLQVTT